MTVTSYESLHKVPESEKFNVLIVDEAHYVKEPGAQRTRRVLGKGGAIHRAERAWCLTGTPTPNHAGELWPLLFASGLTRLGYEDFVDRFCTTRTTGFGRQITGTRAETTPELRAILKPLILRRTAINVKLQLPPLLFQDIIVKPGAVEMAMSRTFLKYVFPVNRTEDLKQLLADQLGIIDGILDGKVTPEAFKGLTAAAKSISTIRMYLGLQKVAPTIELVKGELEANAYEKIVIFAVHRDVVEGLRVGLREFGTVTLYGGTRLDSAETNVRKFQTQKTTRVMIANIATAGTSVNFTAAHNVLFVEQTFVPADIAQAVKRCHRIGQDQPVNVRFMGLANSIDQHIARVLRRKTAEINGILTEETNQEKTTPEELW